MGRDLSTPSPAIRLRQTYPPLPIPYPLSFHILAHSFALFCTLQKLNSFLFKRFRTLCKKPPGVGWVHSPQFPAW